MASPNFWAGEGGIPDRPLLTPEQIASAIVWALTQPEGVDVNALTIRPVSAAIA